MWHSNYVFSAPFRLVKPIVPDRLWGEVNGPKWLDVTPSKTIKLNVGTENMDPGTNLTKLTIDMDAYYTGYVDNVILKSCKFNTTGVSVIHS